MKKVVPGSGVHVWLKHMFINITGFQDTSKTPNKDVISTTMEEVDRRTLYWIFARSHIVLDAEARQLNWALSGGTSGKSSGPQLMQKLCPKQDGKFFMITRKGSRAEVTQIRKFPLKELLMSLVTSRVCQNNNSSCTSTGPNSQGICHCPKRHPLRIYNWSSIRKQNKTKQNQLAKLVPVTNPST